MRMGWANTAKSKFIFSIISFVRCRAIRAKIVSPDWNRGGGNPWCGGTRSILNDSIIPSAFVSIGRGFGPKMRSSIPFTLPERREVSARIIPQFQEYLPQRYGRRMNMMRSSVIEKAKITDVQTVLLTGPCTNDPFLSECRKRRSAAFIEIHTDSGLRGLGESYNGYRCAELHPPAVAYFAPILLGRNGDAVPLLWQWLQQ